MNKKLKQYKIQVPEEVVIEGLPGPIKTYTRQEINELIKKHAEKLGYWRSEDYEWYYDVDCIYFWPDGEIIMDGIDFDSPDITFQEISWQDFLKLTPEDVEVSEPIFGERTTPDRNEIALEILKIIIPMNIEGHKNISDDVEYSFKYADEFLKQVGSK